MKNLGQYDKEYSKCPCFWGKEPSKYVKMISQYSSSGDVLDLGAGEGKNSFYLASLGFNVTAVEISTYAVKNFLNRMIEEGEKNDFSDNINVICGDVKKIDNFINKKFDIIVAYGLLHCFNSRDEISEFLEKIKNLTIPGGINVISTFTDELPVPEIQDYLTPTLLKKEEIKEYYKDWEVLNYENGILEHEHPTSKTLHKHSLCRIIVRKKINENKF